MMEEGRKRSGVAFEQTFIDFLLQHQEKHNRTYHFLILMDALISAAKHIQHYYLTGALKGNLGLAGAVNVQGEDVMRMDQIAHEITIHYLKASGRVIHAVSEESDEIIPIDPEGGRYFVYFDPLDGSSNVPARPAGRLPVRHRQAQPDGARGRPPEGRKRLYRRGHVRDTHRAFTIGLKDAGAWRFHVDETMTYVRPTRMVLPEDPKELGIIL